MLIVVTVICLIGVIVSIGIYIHLSNEIEVINKKVGVLTEIILLQNRGIEEIKRVMSKTSDEVVAHAEIIGIQKGIQLHKDEVRATKAETRQDKKDILQDALDADGATLLENLTIAAPIETVIKKEKKDETTT